MKFTDKTDVLIKDLVQSSEIIGEVLSAPPAFIERMMAQGCFQVIAYCKEEHGIDLPVNVDDLLAHVIGQDGLDAAKKYCEEHQEHSLINVLASPVNPKEMQP
jgi:hypothetical protein